MYNWLIIFTTNFLHEKEDQERESNYELAKKSNKVCPNIIFDTTK